MLKMALCGLCRNSLREQFVAKSDSSEYIHCSNHTCGYFCSLDELASYESGAVGRGLEGVPSGFTSPAERVGPACFSAGPIWK